MNRTITHNRPSLTGSLDSTFWLGLLAAFLLAVICVMAYSVKQDGAVELQTAPVQTLLFFDITTNKL